MKDAADGFYAGILIEASRIAVTFGEVRSTKGREAEPPLRMHAVPRMSDTVYRLDAYSDDVAATERQLRRAVAHLVSVCPEVRGVGVASYGPLVSVDIDARDNSSESNYGVLWKHTRHPNLRSLRVYDTTIAALNESGSSCNNVRVHTDVSCGAIAESLDLTLTEDPIVPGDIVYCATVAEGVGGSFASGGRPWIGTMHSEAGYAAAQIVRNDFYGWQQFVKAGPDFAVFMEQLIEVDAVLARTGCKRLEDIDADHREWVFIAEYCAQLVQLAAVVISPKRVVLEGPIFSVRASLLSEVRSRFDGWLKTAKNVQPVFYEAMTHPLFINKPSTANPKLRGALLLNALKDADLRRQTPIWVAPTKADRL